MRVSREEITRAIQARKTLSYDEYARTMAKPFVQDEEELFNFDLQLFGKDGGKSGGKLFASILFGIVGFFWGGALFGVAKWGGALLGASLGGSIWQAVNPPKMESIDTPDTSSPDVQRFDRAQEQMSSEGLIPVVYGYRKLSGNQTYHQTNAEANQLHKHVVLCEGGIEGIVNVCANDLLIPTGGQASNTVFTISNQKYPEAAIGLHDRHLVLAINGSSHDIYLCNKDDVTGQESFFEWQLSVTALISYINRLGEGWQAFPCSTTNKMPGDLKLGGAAAGTTPSGAEVQLGEYSQYFKEHPNEKPEDYIGKTLDKDGKTYKITRISKGWKSKWEQIAEGSTPTSPLGTQYIFAYGVEWVTGQTVLNNGAKCYQTPICIVADTVVGGTSYTFHDCEPPSNYNEVGGYPNLAWLDMYFTTSTELNGNPSVDCIVKGKRVYDWRYGATMYSTNPAVCLCDFLLSKRYGLGKWIKADDLDVDSWTEAADYCDEIIEFHNSEDTIVKAKRYELNMIIDQSQPAINWVQEILANFCGYITLAGGKLKLKIEKREPISYKFDDSTCSDLSVAPMKLSETPNKYSVKIIDPLNNWKAIACLCEDYADQKERGRVVTHEVQLNGVTSQNQALRLARFYRDYNLVCPLNVSFKTGQQALHLECGDVVTIKYKNVFDGLPIRINEITENEEGEYTITGRQYNPDIYNDDLGGGIRWYNYTPVDSPADSHGKPLQVSNLTAEQRWRKHYDGSMNYEVVVKFELPRRYDVNTAVVYYKVNNAIADEITDIPEDVPLDELGFHAEWKTAGESSGTMLIKDAQVGERYQIKVRAKTDDGKLSDDDSAPVCFITIQPRKTVPSQPQNLRYDFSEKFLFMWDDVSDADVDYYEVRSDTLVGETTGMLARTQDTQAAVTLRQRKGMVFVYAVNSEKSASYPAMVEYEYPAPEAPSDLSVAECPRGVILTVPPATNANVRGTVFYITGVGYSHRFVINDFTMQFLEEPNVYEVKAAYYDLMGEGEMSIGFAAVINPTFNPEWIKDGSVSIEKIDGVTKDTLEALKETAAGLQGIKEDIAKLTVSDTNITATVADVQSKLATQIKQLSNQIDFAVVDGKKGIASDLKLLSDQVTSIVADLNKDPSEAKYSAITQLIDAINLRVKKGDVINQINMTSNGTVIDGKYLHITGTTKFDNNVITDKMIKAGAITAEKLAAGSINASSISAKELSAITARIGLLRTKEHGARVEISDNLIKVFDDNDILRVKLGVW